LGVGLTTPHRKKISLLRNVKKGLLWEVKIWLITGVMMWGGKMAAERRVRMRYDRKQETGERETGKRGARNGKLGAGNGKAGSKKRETGSRKRESGEQ
jgi:hypothetical protein